MERRYLDVKDLAIYINRSPGAIRNLVLRRTIPYRKPAGRLLFDRDEIDQWVKNSDGISIDEIFNNENKSKKKLGVKNSYHRYSRNS